MSVGADYTTLVTGAAGGIGRAICHAMIDASLVANRSPAIVAVGSRADAKLAVLQEELETRGAKVFALAADLTSVKAVRSLMERALECTGGLDCVVSNAGRSSAARLAQMSAEQWDDCFALNARATWLLAKEAYESLARRKGNIVAVASMSGLYPHPGYGAYSPAKAALIMLCRQLAQEWAPSGIRVNAVSPGMIHTPLTDVVYQDADVRAKREAMVPLSRIGRPEDIARAVVFLAGPDASYITGENLRVDGGLCDGLLSMIPGRTASR
ncbi:short-chain dehydrogenase/reductase SDR [Thauera phenylacetica B4P]|uniref:Short-chain dehydrogenase/reductase SDR n=1 Tax=Thauera phenylacetica B4P TaxID=1234382 RepID=N6Z0U7_9RHOO|nr:SDR family NAD(P)-dependent oxidoreductase [Thauera phenylacetica]ENO97450.1 short-chain dehydrogenase/reductase SDR [Thauera phenylacetica B4P]